MIDDNHEVHIKPLAGDMPAGLKIATCNIQSLKSKLGQVQPILSNNFKEAAIIGCTETWFEKNDADKDIQIENDRLVACKDRPHNGWASVPLYTHKDLPLQERIDLMPKSHCQESTPERG